MSKAKDKARANAGNGHKTIPEGKQFIKCQYPPCKTNILIDKMVPGVPYKGSLPFCLLHLEMLNFHVWCVTAIKMEPQKTSAGLIVPGHQQFTPTLNKQEIPIKLGG